MVECKAKCAGAKGKRAIDEETEPCIIDAVNDIMDNGDPVKCIMDVYNSYHVGDRQLGTVMLLSVANQSILNSEGIQPKLSGGSGKGKTHAAKTMFALLPEGRKIEGSLSAKSLFYSPDLEEGTTVFSDDVRIGADLDDTLKRSMSNFQTLTIHRTLNGNREYEELSIPPRVCWWMTSVNSDYSDELINRLYDASVDESTDTDRAVTEQQLGDAVTGHHSLPDVEDMEVRACREIIRRIKSELFTIRPNVPYIKVSSDTNSSIGGTDGTGR